MLFIVAGCVGYVVGGFGLTLGLLAPLVRGLLGVNGEGRVSALTGAFIGLLFAIVGCTELIVVSALNGGRVYDGTSLYLAAIVGGILSVAAIIQNHRLEAMTSDRTPT